MMRRTSMKRSSWGRRNAPQRQNAVAEGSRELILEARAARTMAEARPRAAVVASASSAAVPQPKEAPVRSEAYRRTVASMPCVYCGIQGFSQHAHANEGKGFALKADDRTGFPLCCTRPGIDGCHVAFDQYRLLPGGREAHRAAARAWGEQTRQKILDAGLWPQSLPQWNQGGNDAE